MSKRNSNFEKFENTVNLIYTVCAISDMMTWTMFTIVSMVRITGVEISFVQIYTAANGVHFTHGAAFSGSSHESRKHHKW